MKLTEISKNELVNKGYEDGFHGQSPKHTDDETYMMYYRIGKTDRTDRNKHLKNKQKNNKL